MEGMGAASISDDKKKWVARLQMTPFPLEDIKTPNLVFLSFGLLNLSNLLKYRSSPLRNVGMSCVSVSI